MEFGAPKEKDHNWKNYDPNSSNSVVADLMSAKRLREPLATCCCAHAVVHDSIYYSVISSVA